MQAPAPAARWQELQGKRSALESRWREYSEYTLPYLLPPRDGETKDAEMRAPQESLGAAAVNQLANRVADTLFPVSAQTSFFKLGVTARMRQQIMRTVSDPTLVLQQVATAAAEAERAAMERLAEINYRSNSVTALKLLIVTGNALVVHPQGPKERVRVYSPLEYVVDRDNHKNLLELVLREVIAFGALPQEMQDKLKKSPKGGTYKPDTQVKLYTHLTLVDEKYRARQFADDVDTGMDNVYSPEQCPYIVLTWNLRTGDCYGRGLVEEFSSSFYALDILSASIVQLAAIAADVKFLVSPSSVLDPTDLQRSRSGSYHIGEDGDVSTTSMAGKLPDIAFAREKAKDLERQISAAFMMNTALVRDAERVTATELRMQAQELEQALGGIYSHLSSEWQLPLAQLILADVGFEPDSNVKPVVLTGLATLSRTADVERLALVMNDIGMLAAVPPELRDRFDPARIIKLIAEGRGIDADKFLFSADEYAAIQQQRAAAQEEQMQQQLGMQVAADAAKQTTA